MSEQTFFENLEVLERRDPLLAEEIQTLSPAPARYQWADATSGAPTVRLVGGNSLWVHSPDDPLAEATELVHKALKNPHRILVLIGFGLGYTAQALFSNRPPTHDYTVIIEPDLELFHKSLQITRLGPLLSEPSIHWIVGEPVNRTISRLYRFFAHPSVVVRAESTGLIELPSFGPLYPEIHTCLQQELASAKDLALASHGSFEDSLWGFENTMNNLPVVLESSGISALHRRFSNVPGFVVSAGPSLDLALPEMRLLEERGIVIATDATLSALIAHEIQPHLVATIERGLESKVHFDHVPNTDMSAVAFYPVVPAEVFSSFKGPRAVVYRDYAYFDYFQPPMGTIQAGSSSGHLAFRIAEYLGCNPIILIGQDFAYHPETFALHAQAVRPTDLDRPTTLADRMKKDRAVWVPGTTREALSDPWFAKWTRELEWHVAEYPGEVINTAPLGARIRGTTFRPLAEALKPFSHIRMDYGSRVLTLLSRPSPPEVESRKQVMRDKLKTTLFYLVGVQERIGAIKRALKEGMGGALSQPSIAAELLAQAELVQAKLMETDQFARFILQLIANDHIKLMNRWYRATSRVDQFATLLHWFEVVDQALPPVLKSLTHAAESIDPEVGKSRSLA